MFKTDKPTTKMLHIGLVKLNGEKYFTQINGGCFYESEQEAANNIGEIANRQKTPIEYAIMPVMVQTKILVTLPLSPPAKGRGRAKNA